MSQYCFFALCVILLFAAVAKVSAVEEISAADDRGLFSSLLKNALKLLGKEFGGAAESCIKEAAHECKHEVFHPKKLIKCAGDFLKENKGRCLVDGAL